MADQPNKKQIEDKSSGDFYYRRSGFSIFDFWKNPGWRLGTGGETKGIYTNVAVIVSFAFAFWIEWADIVGGASLARIAAFFIIISAVSFYFLIRLRKTLFWSAVIAACAAALSLTLQIRHWFSNDLWPGWVLGDISFFTDVAGEVPTGIMAWLADQSAIVVLIGAAIAFGILALLVERLKIRFS